MKKYQKILLASLSVIVLITGGLCLWQRDNIKALYLYLTQDGTALSQSLTDSKVKTEDQLKREGVTVPDLTPEQETALINGTLTPADVIAAIEASFSGKGDEPESPTEAGTPSAQQPAGNPTEKPAEKSKAAEITNRYVAKLYGHKAQFLGTLGGLFASAKAEYLALPAEQRTAGAKRSIAMGYAIQGAELEAQCDRLVSGTLNELSAQLSAIGADTSIVATLKSAYSSEKAAKKAYYLSLM